MSSIPERLKSIVLPTFFLFISTAAVTTTGQMLQKQKSSASMAAEIAPFSYVEPRHMPAIILGQTGLYHDFLELWLMQRVGDVPMRDEGAGERMRETIRSVIRQEPKIESLYMISCISMFSDYNMPESCQEITLTGIQMMPRSWRLPMLQGYVHSYLLHQPGLAAAFFDHASALPSSPPYVKSLANKLAKQEGITLEDARENLKRMLWDNEESGIQRFIKR